MIKKEWLAEPITKQEYDPSIRDRGLKEETYLCTTRFTNETYAQNLLARKRLKKKCLYSNSTPLPLLSDTLVKELKESDVIIISAPIYNYGPPATLKAWSDLAARVNETFRFKPNGRREGLLKNKRAYLVITSGGTKLNSNEDFLTPWLKFILNFLVSKKLK